MLFPSKLTLYGMLVRLEASNSCTLSGMFYRSFCAIKIQIKVNALENEDIAFIYMVACGLSAGQNFVEDKSMKINLLLT